MGANDSDRRNPKVNLHNLLTRFFLSPQAHHTLQSTPMAELPIRSLAPPSLPTRQKPNLASMPIEIKNEISSHLLLAENVEYFKPGIIPGYAYNFHTNIMRTNKQFNKEANDYLRAHNDFALIHIKYSRLSHDSCPYVAIGNKARSFKNPAIEATVEDLEPKAIRPDHLLKFCNGPMKARVERVLLLAQDLAHFCRHLQLEIHVWPSSQIYIHPERVSEPVEYTPMIVRNHRKIVWKVNASRRSDLTLDERRTRQQSLISSISTVIGHNLTIRYLGVEQDIAAQAITSMTPRIVSVDAVGWNLLQNMQSQKRQLDDSLLRGPLGSEKLRRAYVMVAQLVDPTRRWFPDMGQYSTAFLFNTPYVRMPPRPVSMICFRDEDEFHTMAGPWIEYVHTTALECLLNAMSLALDDNDFEFLADACGVAWTMAVNTQLHCPLPRELSSLATHYYEWSGFFTGFCVGGSDCSNAYEVMQVIGQTTSTGQADYSYRKEDLKYLRKVFAVSSFADTVARWMWSLTCAFSSEWLS
jgi:hypothetical protein